MRYRATVTEQLIIERTITFDTDYKPESMTYRGIYKPENVKVHDCTIETTKPIILDILKIEENGTTDGNLETD